MGTVSNVGAQVEIKRTSPNSNTKQGYVKMENLLIIHPSVWQWGNPRAVGQR